MQLKKSALVCAAAFAAMGVAHADIMSPDAVTAVNSANTNSRIIFISGASAVQSGFTSIINNLFTGTTYRFANTTASSKDFEAVAGTLAAGTGTWAGQSAIVIYRTKGGSVQGVDPVARATPIEAMNVTSTCGGIATPDAATGNGTASSPYTCLTTTNRIPDAGVSDVAPSLFKNPVNTEGEVAAAQLSAAELALFTGNGSLTPIYGLSFGIPVTSNVPTSVAFTRSAVAGIMSGNITTWDKVDTNSTLPADPIVICRRVPGSGTQAVMNLWAGNYPCSTAASLPKDRLVNAVDPDEGTPGVWDDATNTYTAANTNGGLIVIENSTSGDVRNCLTYAEKGGSYGTKDRNGAAVTVEFGAGGYKAIGVLSMDSLSSSISTHGTDSKGNPIGYWSFRALDGAGSLTWDNTAVDPVVSADATGKLPTKTAYESGDWDLQGWVSFNIPARTAPGSAKRAVLDKFISFAQSPTILANSSSLKNVAMAIPRTGVSGAQVLDAVYVGNNQCGAYYRKYND